MDPGILLKGLIIGFSIAAPVGPIGVLCIRRTLAYGRASGLATGMGVATADGFYGMVAGFSLTFISNLLVSQQLLIRLIGGTFICYLGIKTLLSKPGGNSEKIGGKGLAGTYISTFFLTLTNPLTIMFFAAVFAGLGLGSSSGTSYSSASLMVFGVFLGSALWWIILTTAVSFFRSRLNSLGLRWINFISGLIITVFGVTTLLSLLLTNF